MSTFLIFQLKKSTINYRITKSQFSASVQVDNKVDAMVPLALESQSSVLETWSTSQKSDISTGSVSYAIDGLEFSDPGVPGAVERPLQGSYLPQLGLGFDPLLEHQSVTGHPVANGEIVRVWCC